MSNSDFQKLLNKDEFASLSINIRSLPGKIDELSSFLYNPNNDLSPDFIALQEIWNVPSGVSFHIEGFHPLIYKIRDKSGLSANIGGGGGYFLK